jgi:hypothetical protein
MRRVPALVGIAGHFQGEIKPLEYGKTFVIGRSREADVSVRRTRRYRAQTPEQRDQDEVAQMISGKHFQLTLNNPQSIELRNLSVNGTRLDGRAIDSVVIDDILERVHAINFGLAEEFRLEMREVEDEE